MIQQQKKIGKNINLKKNIRYKYSVNLNEKIYPKNQRKHV